MFQVKNKKLSKIIYAIIIKNEIYYFNKYMYLFLYINILINFKDLCYNLLKESLYLILCYFYHNF